MERRLCEKGRVVSLRPITDANRAQVEALSVSELQQQFVSSVTDSLREAADDIGGRAIHWAIYADETPVGFVMISDEVDGPQYRTEGKQERGGECEHDGSHAGDSTGGVEMRLVGIEPTTLRSGGARSIP